MEKEEDFETIIIREKEIEEAEMNFAQLKGILHSSDFKNVYVYTQFHDSNKTDTSL